MNKNSNAVFRVILFLFISIGALAWLPSNIFTTIIFFVSMFITGWNLGILFPLKREG
jgi:hypothetical protein